MENTVISPANIHNWHNKSKYIYHTLEISASGSLIIQDRKLAGAVTHVLVNDPSTEYGIFIENMLDAAA